MSQQSIIRFDIVKAPASVTSKSIGLRLMNTLSANQKNYKCAVTKSTNIANDPERLFLINTIIITDSEIMKKKTYQNPSPSL